MTTTVTADIVAIQQLVAGFAHLVDSGQGDALAALFTDDGVLDMGHTVVNGSVQLREFATSLPARFPDVRHVISTTWVQVDDDTAQARAYAVVYATDQESGRTTTLTVGTYSMSLVRRNDWSIARVTFARAPD